MGKFIDEPQVSYKGKFLDEDVIGKPQKQNMFESVKSNLKNPNTRPLSPIGLGEIATNPVMNVPRFLLSAGGVPEEDVYPSIGQAVGGIRGGFGGAVGGAVAGQGLRQVAKGVIRKQPTDTLGSMGKEALVTGAIEGVTRGAGNIFFRKQIANKAMQALGKKLGQMKDALRADTSISIPSEEIYLPMKQAYEEVAVPHGPQKSLLDKWMKFMEKNPNLNAKNLIEMESDLGQVADFGIPKKGAIVMPNIAKPELNKIAKGSRRQVSDVVDTLAENQGMPFKKTSRQMSKMISKFPEFDPSKPTGGFGTRLMTAGGVTAATGNPLLGIVTYLAEKGIQSPQFRNAAFKAVENPIAKNVGRAIKLMASEKARQV